MATSNPQRELPAAPARAPAPHDLIPSTAPARLALYLAPALALAWGGIALAAFGGPPWSAYSVDAVMASALVVCFLGARSRSGALRASWLGCLLALALLTAAQVLSPGYAQGAPLVSDALLVASCFMFFGTAITLLQETRPTRDSSFLFDVVLVIVALVPAWWPSFVVPVLDDHSISAPDATVRLLLILAALLLVAVTVQLLAAASTQGAPVALLGVGLLLMSALGLVVGADARLPEGVAEAGWLIAAYCCAIAAILVPQAPGAGSLVRGERRRLLVLPAITVVGPASVFLAAAMGAELRSAVLLAGACAVVTFLLVALRLSSLISVERESGVQRGMDRFAALVQSSQDAIYVVDPGAVISYASPSAQSFTGHPPDELIGTPLTDCFPAEDTPRILDHLARASVGELGGIVELDGPYVGRDGAAGEFEMSVVNLLGTPEVQGLVVTARDVTARRRLERELARKALRDELTGLANRALFMDRLGHALNRLKRAPGTVAVMFLDLDDFKAVNDGLGHSAGDALLVAVAERLHSCMRPTDTIARLGGDEFAVLLEEIDGSDAAMQTAERLLEILQLPVPIDEFAVNVPASIGLAVTTEAAAPESLMRDADIALYRAKGAGKARVALFDSLMRWAAYERLRVRTELSRAIEQEALRLVYQPIVTLGTDEIRGAEALLRWDHPTLGSVPPEEFIPLAEESGLIYPIGLWVLEQACAAAARWNTTADHDVYVSVNVSAWQLREAAFADDLAAVLAATGLRAELLMIELTESALIDEIAAANLIERVVPLGVAVAIDDFGTGYSSLAYLQRLPVDVVKIDRSFVSGIGQDGTRAVVESIAAIARVMGFSSIAEGIETDEQLAHLEGFDCRYGQGYRYSQPIDVETLLVLLTAGQDWRALGDAELALRARAITAGS